MWTGPGAVGQKAEGGRAGPAGVGALFRGQDRDEGEHVLRATVC